MEQCFLWLLNSKKIDFDGKDMLIPHD